MKRIVNTFGSYIRWGGVVLVSALLLSACSKDENNTIKDEDNPPKEPQYQIDVHVVGEELDGSYDVATYWKNGEAIRLGDGTANSNANSIVVSDGDIHISGQDGEAAMYWKNGQPSPLTDGSKSIWTGNLFLSNRDVYIIGNEYNGSKNTAMYWKNGIKNTIEEGKYNTVWSIFVAEGSIYAAGNHSSSPLPDVATIWKDGVPTVLPNGHRANSVFVENGNVHAVGVYSHEDKSIAMYWKNGTPQALTDGTEDAEASSLQMHDGNIYIAGHSGLSAVYWKNGELVRLTGDNQYGAANSIFVLEDDIYVAGVEYKLTGSIIATYWKNGIATALTSTIGEAKASSIFVTKTLVE